MATDLSLELLRVAEQAAIACAHTMGQGDRHASDQAAVEAMRKTLDSVPIDGTIVIGEGERDEAPMLFIGEKVGQGAAGPLTKTSLLSTQLEALSLSLAPTICTRLRRFSGQTALRNSFRHSFTEKRCTSAQVLV